ncbi:hypothetical protein H8E50_04265 [bacterium]|nr:hypothetical protein [bacterium]
MRFLLFLLFILLVSENLVIAQPIQKSTEGTSWQVNGSNMTRFEWYNNRGNPSSSPYSFEGDQFHNDLVMDVTNRPSQYELFNFRFNGTYNDSSYRGRRGLRLEGASGTWEKGDGFMPYRLTGGDFFAAQTDRTVQRSLKGALVEFQPSFGNSDLMHSFQVFSGFSAPNYYEFDAKDDYYNGASWLIEDGEGGLLLSLSHNKRQSEPVTSLVKRNQYTMSAAYERDLSYAGQDTTMELEYSYFHGNPSTDTVSSHETRTDGAFYAALQGKSKRYPLTYRASFEQYGEDFKPNGALVGSDQRRYNGKTSWNFENRSRIEGRFQRYEDGIESTNPKGTNTYGLKYSTPFPGEILKGSNVYLDGYYTTVANKDKTTDTDTRSISGRASIPVMKGLSASTGASFRQSENRVAGNQTSDTQVNASFVKAVSFYGIEGSIRPGWTSRFYSGTTGDQETHSPTIAVNASYQEHSVQLSHNTNFQDARDGGTDVTTDRTSANYTYSRQAHSLSIYGDRIERDPYAAQSTRSYRVGTLYTYNFDYTFAGKALSRAGSSSAVQTAGSIFITDMPSGADLVDAQERLALAGATGPVGQGEFLIYDMPMFAKVDERQRVVLEKAGNSVSRTWLVIGEDFTGNIDELRDAFEQTRSAIIKMMGQPSQIVEKGEYTASLLEDISARRFVRLMEWQTQSGVLRLGIPERLDGRLRVEAVYSGNQIKPLKETRWAVDEIQ